MNKYQTPNLSSGQQNPLSLQSSQTQNPSLGQQNPISLQSNQSQNPSLGQQDPINLQRVPDLGSIESLKSKRFDLETQPNAKNLHNYEKPSEMDLLVDAGKYFSNYKLLFFSVTSLVALTGFALKSKALRRAIVKKNMVHEKI